MSDVKTQSESTNGMAAREGVRSSGSRAGHRRWVRTGLLGSAALPVVVIVTSVLLTPKLEPAPSVATPLPPPELSKAEAARARLAALPWPVERSEGAQAKALLLDIMLAVQQRLEAVEGYSASMMRQERVNGRLGPEQDILLKVRHRPFAVYMKFLNHDTGKEAVYADGRYDNNVMGHGGGLTRAFLPRLKVPPDSPIAMAGNRHPITDAGLLNLTNKLVHFRKLDISDEDAETILDRVTDAKGRNWLRSIHTHSLVHPTRPFVYVEVLYDPETMIPHQIDSYDWPRPGHAGERLLAERYRYEDVQLDAPLTDLDFDPANPDYDFRRF